MRPVYFQRLDSNFSLNSFPFLRMEGRREGVNKRVLLIKQRNSDVVCLQRGSWREEDACPRTRKKDSAKGEKVTREKVPRTWRSFRPRPASCSSFQQLAGPVFVLVILSHGREIGTPLANFRSCRQGIRMNEEKFGFRLFSLDEYSNLLFIYYYCVENDLLFKFSINKLH